MNQTKLRTPSSLPKLATPHESTGKSRDRVKKAECMHPEFTLSPRLYPRIQPEGKGGVAEDTSTIETLFYNATLDALPTDGNIHRSEGLDRRGREVAVPGRSKWERVGSRSPDGIRRLRLEGS